MTLPATGSISMAQVAAELGVSQTGINLNQANVRALAGKPSGAISMSDLRGKSAGPAGVTMTIGTQSSDDGYEAISNYGFASPGFGSLSSTTGMEVGGAVRSFYWAYVNQYYPSSGNYYNLTIQFSTTPAKTPKRAKVGTTYFTLTKHTITANTWFVNLTAAQYNALPKSGTVNVDVVST